MTGRVMARLHGEAGYTLTELLVALAILGFSMAAVFGIYQVAQRSTIYATAGEDAQLSTRGALDRVVADLRLINAGRPAPTAPSSATGFITAASSSSITFLADIDNDTLDSSGNDATLTAAASSGATTVTVSSVSGFSVGEYLAIADGPTVEAQSITAINTSTKVITLGAGLSTSYPVGAVVRSIETVTYTYTSNTSTLTRTVGSTTDTLADNLSGFTLTYYKSVPRTAITDVSTQANRDTITEIDIEITSLSSSGGQNVKRTMLATVRPRNLF